LPPLPEAALREALRHNVLHFLCSEGVLDTGLAERMLMNHIPGKYEHLVRYYGYYSNRSQNRSAQVHSLRRHHAHHRSHR
jgi:hypothetical protein